MGHDTDEPRVLDRLDDATAAAVRALADASAAHDTVAPLNEEALLGLVRPGPGARHLLLGDPTRPIGYGSLDRGTAQLTVAPDHRRHGRGRRLAERLLDLDPAARFWAFGDLAGGRALATALALRPVRELLALELPADGLARLTAGPASPPSAGLTLREFVPDTADEADWIALNAVTFADHPEQGRITLDDLRARIAEPWFDPAGFLLATDGDGRLLGYHWTKLDGGGPGEVYVLGVHPDAAGRGLGRTLLDAGLRHLAARGATTIELYVEGDNHPARRLYEKSGFTLANRDVMYAR